MSSKKPFDHIEEKIKLAAENSFPAFDEKAWDAMEAKLDKDQKKRRPFLWWFILPLILAGTLTVYYTFKDSTTVQEKPASAGTAKSESENKAQNLPGNNDNATAPGGNAVSKSNKTGNVADESTAVIAGNKSNLTKDQTSSTVAAPSFALSKHSKAAYRKKGRMTASSSGAATGEMDDDKPATDKTGIENKEAHNTVVLQEDKNDKKTNETVTGQETKPAEAIKDESKQEDQPVKTEVNKQEEKSNTAKKEKEKSGIEKGFYLLATGGIDAGSTKLFSYSNSSVTPKYGIGLGYQFNNRLSVQTGFYIANKKYVAGPDDYTVKPGSLMGMYRIDKIKAACLVYEIPLAVRYNIINKPTVIFYGTAGASSYIMKSETYNCSYTYYNTTYEKEWLYNGNRHLFSTAVFSLGIEKKLSSKVSLLAEPSFSVPLTGVGDGKVKLYSSTLQLGLKYRPRKK